MKLEFYPIDFDYGVTAGKPVIYIYGRTIEGKQVCVLDEDFVPYFYVVPKKGASIKVTDYLKELKLESKDEKFTVEKVEAVKKILLGKEVDALKVIVNIPKAVPTLREEIKRMAEVEQILEFDIPFTKRYLLDKKITPLILTDVTCEPAEEKLRVPAFRAKKIEQSSNESLNSLKTLAFDIETYNPNGKSTNPEMHPIVMVSLFGKGYGKVITWKRFPNNCEFLEVVEGEAQLLERFKECVLEYGPDVLVGYYSDGFDLPYMVKRAEKYKMKLDFGLDYSSVNLPRGRASSVDSTGIVHIDILNCIKRIIARKLKTDTLTLDAVAGELLGEKKDVVDMNGLAKAWDQCTIELEAFANYNLKDSRLTYELCEKIMPNVIELVRLVGQSVKDVHRMSFSQLVEWYIMKRAGDFGQFIPNKPHQDELTARYDFRFQGAFVYEPKPGLYERVSVFDFRSLYPSIIVSHNISIETLDCDCCKDKEKVPGTNHWFCRKKKGFFSTVLEDIIVRRMRVKEIMKKTDPDKRVFLDARQESLKILANAYYGYMGFFGARWYNKDCAMSVTAYGRYYIQKVIALAQETGFGVLYSDTDSIFLHLQNKTEKDAVSFVEKVNATLPGMMELDFQGIYKRALFVSIKDAESGAKKKYALIDDKNAITIKGFEMVRRNVSNIAKDTQEEVIRLILQDSNPSAALKFVQRVITDLKEKKISTEDVAVATMLTKAIESYDSVGPHVAAAKRLRAKGVDIYPGMIIRYVVVAGKEKIRDRAKLPDEVKVGEYDPEYYIQNQVIPAVENILAVFGYSVDEMTGEKKQSKLGDYFG